MAEKVILNRDMYEKFCEENDVAFPFSDNTDILASEINIGKIKIPNRIVYQPMEGCDGKPDGGIGELTRRRYIGFAKGGAGLIWFEATAVMEEGRANPRQLYMTRDNMHEFAALLKEIKKVCLEENGYEPVVIMQLTHSGRYSKPHGVPAELIACNNPYYEAEPLDKAHIVDDDYLLRLSDALVQSARMAYEAGFDGVDIKSCHRYLLSELLSAHTRGGAFGGSFENRTRLLFDTIKRVIKNSDENFIVTTRVNLYDGVKYPYGFASVSDGELEIDIKESIALAKGLRDCGVKIVNFTMGNPYVNPHVNRPYRIGGYEPPEKPAQGIKRMLYGIKRVKEEIPDVFVISSAMTFFGSVCGNVSAGCINEGWFDLAGFGRMTLANPDIAKELIRGDKISKVCLTCSKCTQIMRQPGGTPGCPVYDREVYLPIFNEKCKK